MIEELLCVHGIPKVQDSIINITFLYVMVVYVNQFSNARIISGGFLVGLHIGFGILCGLSSRETQRNICSYM